MDVSQMMKASIPVAQFIKLDAARMVTAPRARTAQVETMEDVYLPLGQIRKLAKPVFGFSIFITEAFRTKERPNDIMAKLDHITFQRQKLQAFMVREVSRRMPSP